jgi:hypothetical protein
VSQQLDAEVDPVVGHVGDGVGDHKAFARSVIAWT